jgi:hypothetical protein
MRDRFEFTTERKKQTIELVDRLADVLDAADVDDSVVIAALGSLLTYAIVNAASEHNAALSVVKHFTENLVNSIDDAFTK